MLQASQRRRFEVDLLRMLRTSSALNSIKWPLSACSAWRARRAMPVGCVRMGKRAAFSISFIFAICSPIGNDNNPAWEACQEGDFQKSNTFRSKDLVDQPTVG